MDFNNKCVSCFIFEKLDTLSGSYAAKVFQATHMPVFEAFSVAMALWLAYQLVVNGLFKGELDFRAVGIQASVLVVVSVLLRQQSLVWEYIYYPARDLLGGVPQWFVKPAGGISDTSLVGLLRLVEKEIRAVLDAAWLIGKQAGFSSIYLLFAAVLMILPYLFVWVVFCAFVVEGIFKLLAMTAFSSFLIAFAGFPMTRGFAVSGFRVLLSGILTVVFAALSMGFTLEVVQFFTGDLPRDGAGLSAETAGRYVASGSYWGLVILGFISILLHLKAATIASNISGANDGPGAAAAVVGAGMSAVGLAKAGSMWAASRSARLAGAGGRRAFQEIMKRMGK